MKKFPIGIDNFKNLIEGNYYFIDKSLFINEIWEDSEIVLITRPRRFGKTLNMSMLKYFFDNREDNSKLFEGLNIYSNDEMMKLQGKIPVIFLSFRGCSASDFSKTVTLINTEILREVLRFEYIKSNLSENHKKLYDNLISIDAANMKAVESSISILSELITLSLGIQPIILIDEYDNPINNAYIKGFYKELIDFLKPFYENTLKSNNYIQKAVLTGILRVAKESIFSGLNNLNVHTILSNRYSDKFGFTQNEVEEYLSYYNIDYKIEYVKDYYDGYTFGKSEIFNPWSIIKYSQYILDTGGLSKNFWINTSSNDLIKNLLVLRTEENKKDIEKLLNGEAITKTIDENVVFNYLNNDQNSAWSLMLFSGYLKIVEIINQRRVALKIPNKEVRSIFEDVIINWLNEKYTLSRYDDLIENLIEGNIEEFEEDFRYIIFNTMSFFDPSGEKTENFYHGFVLGLLALLMDTHHIKYNIKSNREAGKGRADIMIIPKDNSMLGIVLEFKKAKSEEELNESANNALNQINEKKYAEEIQSYGILNIIKIGIAFCGKECEIRWENN